MSSVEFGQLIEELQCEKFGGPCAEYSCITCDAPGFCAPCAIFEEWQNSPSPPQPAATLIFNELPVRPARPISRTDATFAIDRLDTLLEDIYVGRVSLPGNVQVYTEMSGLMETIRHAFLEGKKK